MTAPLHDNKLKRWQIAAFVLPAIPISALGLPLVVHLPFFYENYVGMSAATVGYVLFFLRLWDVVTDPVLGVVSDRYSTQWGRRRHWIVLSVPIIAIATYFLFLPTPGVGAFYLGLWMFILYIGWTLITISHMSWGAELSSDYHERSRIQGWREFALIGGMFGVLAMPAIMELFVDELKQPDIVFAMGIFIIVLLPIAVAAAVTLVDERPAPPKEPIDWREALQVISRNKPLRYLLAADFLQAAATGVTGTLYFWFVPLVLQMHGMANFLLLFYFLAGVVAVPVWIQLSYRIGKHKTFAWAMFYGAAAALPLFIIPPGMFWVTLIGFILFGLAYGAASFLLRAIMADIKDQDALESGQDKTGIYYSLLTLTNKIGYATALLTLPVIQYFGVETGADAQNTATGLFALKLIYIGVPAALLVLAGWIMWDFPLDQRTQEGLQDALQSRQPNLAFAKGGDKPGVVIGGAATQPMPSLSAAGVTAEEKAAATAQKPSDSKQENEPSEKS